MSRPMPEKPREARRAESSTSLAEEAQCSDEHRAVLSGLLLRGERLLDDGKVDVKLLGVCLAVDLIRDGHPRHGPSSGRIDGEDQQREESRAKARFQHE